MQVFTTNISHESQNNLFNASHSVNIGWKIATLKTPLYLLSFANSSEHLESKAMAPKPRVTA